MERDWPTALHDILGAIFETVKYNIITFKVFCAHRDLATHCVSTCCVFCAVCCCSAVCYLQKVGVNLTQYTLRCLINDVDGVGGNGGWERDAY